MKVIYLFLITTLLILASQKTFLNNFEKIKENKIIVFADTELETIRKNLLTRHNYHRKRHQVDNLVRNSEIESIAQSYSEKLAASRTMEHSQNIYKGQSLGENLYACWGSYQIKVNGIEATDSWYSEISLYNFNKPGYTSGVGHFTQLVWKGSKQLGCGASCQNSYCSVTCNYFPAGNYLNQFSSNVFPLKEDSTEPTDPSDSSAPSDSTAPSDTINPTDSTSPSDSTDSTNPKDPQDSKTFNKKGGMSPAGKIFISILVILIVGVIVFCIYHFVFKKRRSSESIYYNQIKGLQKI